ncbi:DUF3710 domain-containing protein [Allonocardiopsis opalescens]|uniref:Uncharacterized protein DUF3710 n=1 Tax=Allonocardiopsis opalescens TaxID=1144618 RepID=A0A2T0PU49_9ACTN|nr:DUF3710 domain-containing protein [Allonocardiopsis opalescens]PRX92425.1 uncharacterized protein DUF3710 [Allonocardiopsis opalescens]
MFGRRRKEAPAEADALRAEPPRPVSPDRPEGPWDESEGFPERERVDLGALRIPTGADIKLQFKMQTGQSRVLEVVMLHGRTTLQANAFAAPKSSGLWDEVRQEMAAELKQLGAEAEEAEGPFGTELRAQVPVQGPEGRTGKQPARFFGVDGPRWFLRGVIRGEGAQDAEAGARLEEVFRGIVVVRGDDPRPPREPLELRMPPQLREAAQQAAQQAQAAQKQAGNGRPPAQPPRRA